MSTIRKRFSGRILIFESLVGVLVDGIDSIPSLHLIRGCMGIMVSFFVTRPFVVVTIEIRLARFLRFIGACIVMMCRTSFRRPDGLTRRLTKHDRLCVHELIRKKAANVSMQRLAIRMAAVPLTIAFFANLASADFEPGMLPTGEDATLLEEEPR